MASLEHERTLLLSHSQRSLLVPAVVSLVSLTHRRIGLRRAVLVFLATRLVVASRTLTPDPRQVVPWPVASR